jgi:hypothetical protein
MCRSEIQDIDLNDVQRAKKAVRGLTFNHPVEELLPVFARHYNILRVMGGMGGLTYSS